MNGHRLELHERLVVCLEDGGSIVVPNAVRHDCRRQLDWRGLRPPLALLRGAQPGELKATVQFLA